MYKTIYSLQRSEDIIMKTLSYKLRGEQFIVKDNYLIVK